MPSQEVFFVKGGRRNFDGSSKAAWACWGHGRYFRMMLKTTVKPLPEADDPSKNPCEQRVIFNFGMGQGSFEIHITLFYYLKHGSAGFD